MKSYGIDEIKFSEQLSLNSPDDKPFDSAIKTEIARRQMIDGGSGKDVCCAKCRRQYKIVSLYRCFYCGVWYCRSCAKEHFADNSEEKKLI